MPLQNRCSSSDFGFPLVFHWMRWWCAWNMDAASQQLFHWWLEQQFGSLPCILFPRLFDVQLRSCIKCMPELWPNVLMQMESPSLTKWFHAVVLQVILIWFWIPFIFLLIAWWATKIELTLIAHLESSAAWLKNKWKIFKSNCLQRIAKIESVRTLDLSKLHVEFEMFAC